MAGEASYRSNTKGKLVGVDLVLKKLNIEIAKIEGRTKGGLRSAALEVKAASLRLTPHEDGHLRGSAYTETFSTSSGPGSVIGYTAEYAPWVHEAPGVLKGLPRPSGKGVFWGPSGEPQFLRKALMRNVRLILRRIKEHVKIK